MVKLLILTLVLFALCVFLFWILTKNHYEKEYSKKQRKTWASRTYFWQAAIFYGLGGTALIILILKSTNLLTF